MSVLAQASQPTYYQILQLPNGGKPIDYNKLKSAYRRALLLHHPDKKYPSSLTASNASAHSPPHSHGYYSVDQISEAFKTLSSAQDKADYDRQLARDTRRLNTPPIANHHLGVDTYDLEELAYSEKISTWSHHCRCGDERAYIVTESDLERESENGEIYVSCKGCSLSIRILFDSASTGIDS
jgi:diphthamide biosynthesis protein 4